MNSVVANSLLSEAHRASVESFYHLRNTDISRTRCSGTACFVARHLKPAEWSATERQAASVSCLGCCYAGPADGLCCERPAVECPAPESIVLARMLKGGARSLSVYQQLGGFRALAAALRQPAVEVIKAVEDANLRGRGGAAFPTAQKWWSAARQPVAEKFIIANGDEGDSGAYIDRFLMEDDPFAVLEGMALAAYAIGSKRGWIYVRKEYPDAEISMRRAIEEAKKFGFLGKRILGTDFDFEVEIFSGHGSYLCGEETALIRSIEGLRPEPQIKPPFSSTKGLFGKPTVMNNIETLVNIPWIVLNSGPAFRAMGFAKSQGTKVVSLNSLFRKPGLYEVEFGITVREIVELGGGLARGQIKGIIIGGPLAGIIPLSLFDTVFGFEELQAIGASVGHGGVIAFDENTSIPELMHHIFSFGAFESCGKCAPCRLGTRRIEGIFGAILAGKRAPLSDFEEWNRTTKMMKLGSLCAHGTGLADFSDSVLRYYEKEAAACFT